MAIFIAHLHHGHTMRQQKSSSHVAHLPASEAQHCRALGLPFLPTVPAQVVALTIPDMSTTRLSNFDTQCPIVTVARQQLQTPFTASSVLSM